MKFFSRRKTTNCVQEISRHLYGIFPEKTVEIEKKNSKKIVFEKKRKTQKNWLRENKTMFRNDELEIRIVFDFNFK